MTPFFFICHVTGAFTPEEHPFIKSLNLAGIRDCPDDLAQAFLNFISYGTAPYTDEELRDVTRVIAHIYKRYANSPS